MIAVINKFNTETQAPFNSPKGGKYSPPSEGLGEVLTTHRLQTAQPS